MADLISREERSTIISNIRSKDTSPEIALRKKLWSAGCRYRLHYGKEKIDIAFIGKRATVFVDGCFWHFCPLHGHIQKPNGFYWEPKLKTYLSLLITLHFFSRTRCLLEYITEMFLYSVVVLLLH